MWRDTASPLGFAGCDARILGAMALWVYHAHWWTFYLALAGVGAFALAERFGLTVPAAWRLLRALAVGRLRAAVMDRRKRRLA